MALHYDEQALIHSLQAGSHAYEANALRVIGEVFLAQQQINEAASYLERAQLAQARVDDPFDQVLLLRALIRLALAQGNRQEASRLAQTGLHLAQKQEVPYLINSMEDIGREIEAS